MKNKTKVCTKCKKRQPVENFPKDNSTKDKLWRMCRNCEKERKAAYYKAKKKDQKKKVKKNAKAKK